MDECGQTWVIKRHRSNSSLITCAKYDVNTGDDPSRYVAEIRTSNVMQILRK